MHGFVKTQAGLLARWRGVVLEQHSGGTLEAPDDQTRVGLDGYVQLLAQGVFQITSGPQFGTGDLDGWAMDPTTGFSVAWRGAQIAMVSGSLLTFKNGYEVEFNRRGLATLGPLSYRFKPGHRAGEYIFSAQNPRNLRRRVRRARTHRVGTPTWPGAGAERGNLFVWQSTTALTWPPELQDDEDEERKGGKKVAAWRKDYEPPRWYELGHARRPGRKMFSY